MRLENIWLHFPVNDKQAADPVRQTFELKPSTDFDIQKTKTNKNKTFMFRLYGWI